MSKKDFFDFGSKLLASTVQAYAIGLQKDENGMHDHWNLVKGNYQNICFPVTFKQDSGKNFTDVLDTGWPNLYLISDRFKTVLNENILTGWQTFLIKLYDKKGNELFGYHGFSITGKCSPTTYEGCKIIERRFVPNGPICKFYKGVCIDKWDSSDFFTPEGTYEIFITAKAADVIKKNKISNAHIENLTEIETNIRHVNK